MGEKPFRGKLLSPLSRTQHQHKLGQFNIDASSAPFFFSSSNSFTWLRLYCSLVLFSQESQGNYFACLSQTWIRGSEPIEYKSFGAVNMMKPIKGAQGKINYRAINWNVINTFCNETKLSTTEATAQGFSISVFIQLKVDGRNFEEQNAIWVAISTWSP